MAELKTRENDGDVGAFLESVENDRRREDCFRILDIMRSITGCEPGMWGDSIVGFGNYHYRYKTGREGDWFLTGFSPGKQKLTIYIMSGFQSFPELMKRLGKYKTGTSCLYINRLDDVDNSLLVEIIQKSVEIMRDGKHC